ncbi:hypothetical protein HUG10_05805 [Halorarum halophilum]|uniref:DUF7847 domain-containing protein n=1 Tax=Halorarum halophilum TaxID=2743090 RepID=A0A7D5GE26_9EURY|nr:hypothetical protein [Halobaculum halophilum]QLG27088.1 hypothetical protein HUG10_05805 [Halobaculum halophilum]
MALLHAFRASLGAIGRNPAILLVTGLIALVQLPQLVAQTFSPVVGAVVSIVFSLVYVVAIPYVQGGLIGMADEALDGRTSLGTFHRAGTEHYVSVLVAYLLVLAVNLVVGGGLFFVGFIALVFALGANLSTAAMIGIGVVAVALLVVYVVAFAFVQFYGQAIVLEDLGGVDGLKRSIGTVRANLLPVFLYTVVVGVIGGVFGLIAGASSLLTSPQSTPGLPLPDPSLPLVVGASVVMIVSTTLFTALFLTFSVAFYRDLRAGETAGSAGRDGAASPSL